ncbi:hypothetical protein LEP1GSC024_2312 [Leptospira noguchii str. 2001034031]|uniref:Uncharacterized protein n=1 Tax=Leptospira noguchii str. 2001034031 TaxID=1193053 RepID=M6XYK3_9LEPT|nr:hypothetical protein LEP1GSC024_2312 [Leptospira noguchii str. 2001034031]
MNVLFYLKNILEFGILNKNKVFLRWVVSYFCMSSYILENDLQSLV